MNNEIMLNEKGSTTKKAPEPGKTYKFAGYKWTVCELVNDCRTAVLQSHGVTHGKWPGFEMEKFGNGDYYADSIDGQDISSYDDMMQALYDAIKDAEDTSTSYGKGLFLISKEKAGFTEWGKSGSGNYWQTLKEATENAPLFGAAYSSTWLGTAYGGTYAWYVNRGGGVYYGNSQDYNDFVVAPAFNLDLSKVEIVGDEIIKKAQPAPSSFEHDDNCQEHQLLGKTYKFAGYKWTACELVNNGKTLVLQSHGVTHGKWPGFVMPQFGNGNYYSISIDGEDISSYDDKMQSLYNVIKEVEDTSASYGKGLYLISEEKVGFTEWGHPGSGNYWQALKAVAENACSFGSPDNYAWLGTVYGYYVWYVNSDGNVYDSSNQDGDYVVAPAFNLDLSKVETVGDEIIIKPKNSQTLEIDKMLTISFRHVSADTKDLLDQAADNNEEDPMPPVYEKQGYGWFVACDPDNEETWDNYPADLVQCMKLARDNGCFWLCLDAAGPRVKTLEFFD